MRSPAKVIIQVLDFPAVRPGHHSHLGEVASILKGPFVPREGVPRPQQRPLHPPGLSVTSLKEKALGLAPRIRHYFLRDWAGRWLSGMTTSVPVSEVAREHFRLLRML